MIRVTIGDGMCDEPEICTMMQEHPYYNQSIHGPYETLRLGNFELEGGDVIRDCVLAYATFGTLNANKDNAVLFPTWYGGTNKIIESAYIGPGRALDPAEWFIVVANQLGNGLSSSRCNTPLSAGEIFPRLRIGDDVRAQHRLIAETFGIRRLALVTGGSMGAQQTYEWSVRFPDMVARAAPFCGTARTTDHNRIAVDTFVDSIVSDPGWREGNYGDSSEVKAGLRRHARLLATMGLSDAFYERQVWRRLGFERVQDFVRGFFEEFLLPLDPNALLCMAWKWQQADVSRHAGYDLNAALGRITAKTYVMPIDEDSFFPPSACAAEQSMIPGSELRVLTSPCGHSACTGIDPDWMAQFDRHIGELLRTAA